MAGIQGLKYAGDFGLFDKPSIKLADLIDHNVTGSELDNIEYNVKMFKQILRR